MDYVDYYKVLGVEKNASEETIKKAYKKLALKYHPDKNPGDKSAETRFKEINEANQILGNKEKRKKYDEMGENWDRFSPESGPGSGSGARTRAGAAGGRPGQRGPQGGYGNFSADPESFSDFFESFFGGAQGAEGYSGARNQRPVKGQNLEASITLTLEDVLKGADYPVNISGNTVNLKLKPGLTDGQRLRLKGKGQPGYNGGDPGDLLIEVRISPHSKYERKGQDLHSHEHIPLYTAVLGGKVDVHTLEKTVRIDIAKGTENNKIMRLKGLGLPAYGKPAERGDSYIQLEVDIPKNLSDEERRLFEQLARLRSNLSI